MAITFLAELPSRGVLQVKITGGRYETQDASVAGKSAQWYFRTALEFNVELAVEELRVERAQTRKYLATPAENTDAGPIKLQIEILARPTSERANSF
jgi:hypothetical protein